MQPGERFVRCLLDQRDEESRRKRRLRRRTLLISILIQALVLTLLLLIPLFGGERIHLLARLVPLPPYRGGRAATPPPENRPVRPPTRHGVVTTPLIRFPVMPPHPAQLEEEGALDVGPEFPGAPGVGPGDPNGLIPGLGSISNTRPIPPPEVTPPPTPQRVRRPSEVQEAMLLERVEPQYPALAKQARIQGMVEIHAIIAKDGRIESAEIASGNVILARAALGAVLRWRYRPTLLNGQPVEVETIIRVHFIFP